MTNFVTNSGGSIALLPVGAVAHPSGGTTVFGAAPNVTVKVRPSTRDFWITLNEDYFGLLSIEVTFLVDLIDGSTHRQVVTLAVPTVGVETHSGQVDQVVATAEEFAKRTVKGILATSVTRNDTPTPVTVWEPSDTVPGTITAVVFGESYYRPDLGTNSPGPQSTYFTPVFDLPELVGETVNAIEWSTSALNFPDNVHEIEQGFATGGHYELRMTDPAKRQIYFPVQQDFSGFKLTDTTRKARLRLRWQEVADGPWSLFSDVFTIPSPAIPDDVSRPTVTINKASTQADPVTGGAIVFTVVFSESVTGFDSSDVLLSGTASPQNCTVTGSGTTYTVSVSGMSGSGTVIASVPEGKATDSVGNLNYASTSTDNSVLYTLPAVTSGGWTQVGARTPTDYADDYPGSRGNQFFRTSSFNQAIFDTARLKWFMAIQDENSVRLTFDGKTWGSPVIYGLYGRRGAGCWFNTDDDLAIYVVDNFSDDYQPADACGVYVGNTKFEPGQVATAARVNLTRGGTQAFVNFLAGNSQDRDGNVVHRRPQKPTGTLLTNAQRPIYIAENDTAMGSSEVTGIWLWCSTDGGATFSSRSLTLSTFKKIIHVKVAPNGDLMLSSVGGCFLLQADSNGNAFGSTITKIFPDGSGVKEVSSIHFTGGSFNTVSGAKIACSSGDSSAGLWSTGNVRANSFSKPVAADNTPNKGLPANGKWLQMGMSTIDPDYLCMVGNFNYGYKSTDGGKTFQEMSKVVNGKTVSIIDTPPGEEAWRYRIRAANASAMGGIFWCPTDHNHVVVGVEQTMCVSTNALVTIRARDSSYYEGMHARNHCVSPSASDWKKIGKNCQDTFVNVSLDGSNWIQGCGYGTGSDQFKADAKAAGAQGSNTNTNYISAAAGLIAGGNSNRVIAALNMNSASQPNILCAIDGRSASSGKYSNYRYLTANQPTRACFSDWSPKSPGTVGFIGRWCITNFNVSALSDLNIVDHSAHEFIACVLDGSTLVSYWCDAPSGGSESFKNIYRSTHDQGTNGQGSAWYTIPNTKCHAKNICLDYDNPNQLYYVRDDAPMVVRRLTWSGSSFTDVVAWNVQTTFDTYLNSKIGSGAYRVDVDIHVLLSDRNMPGVFYAIVGAAGVPNVFRTTDSFGTMSCVQGNAPLTEHQCWVHEWTSDLISGCSLGERVLEPPTGIATWTNKGAYSSQARSFIGKSTVVDPPVFGF